MLVTDALVIVLSTNNYVVYAHEPSALPHFTPTVSSQEPELLSLRRNRRKRLKVKRGERFYRAETLVEEIRNGEQRLIS